CGNATFTMLPSSTTISWATAITTRAIPSLRGAAPVPRRRTSPHVRAAAGPVYAVAISDIRDHSFPAAVRAAQPMRRGRNEGPHQVGEAIGACRACPQPAAAAAVRKRRSRLLLVRDQAAHPLRQATSGQGDLAVTPMG